MRKKPTRLEKKLARMRKLRNAARDNLQELKRLQAYVAELPPEILLRDREQIVEQAEALGRKATDIKYLTVGSTLAHEGSELRDAMVRALRTPRSAPSEDE